MPHESPSPNDLTSSVFQQSRFRRTTEQQPNELALTPQTLPSEDMVGPALSQDMSMMGISSDLLVADFAITWQCPNCGQMFLGKHPPDLCDYCQDFTTWRQQKH